MSYHKPHSQAAQVAHNWAHKFEGKYKKDSEAGSLYYSGDTIYSYGSHFPIAKHVKNKKGIEAVIFTTKGYSNTTAKHLNVVRGAVTHLNVIYCPEVASGSYSQDQYVHNQNFTVWADKIKGIAANLPKAKKPFLYIEGIESVLEEMKKYADFFGCKPSKELAKFFKTPIEGFKKMAEKAAIQKLKLQKEREAKEAARIVTELTEFRAFEREHINNTGNAAYLRYNTTSKRIETSKGVEIPVAIAKRFYGWYKSTVTAGGCSGNCSETILDYKVKSANTKELVVGCHTISTEEIQLMAALLKW